MGFGFTLLAVSFFLLIIQSGDAVQLLIVVNLAISLALISKLWRTVDRALWTRLVAGAFLGFISRPGASSRRSLLDGQ